MSNKIQKLDNTTINRIAAGEVIERPASVVKETLENSIDAGANRIVVEINKGGQELIRIIDNGRGIREEELLLIFERHATSKITELDDLYKITSLGFRGEALASISSVADVEMITYFKDESTAFKISMEAGSEIKISPTQRSVGTTFTVSNIFKHVPVRKKFLKSVSSENMKIAQMINHLALLYPKIAFRLVIDGKEKINYPSVDLVSKRLKPIFGTNMTDSFMTISYSDDIMEIEGFTSNLNFTKGNRTSQHFFVNGRRIENPALFQGIRLAYLELLPHGRFSASLIFIKINFDEIDVNVHPQKSEIRFTDERHVVSAISKAIKKAFADLSVFSGPSNTPPIFTNTNNYTSTNSSFASPRAFDYKSQNFNSTPEKAVFESFGNKNQDIEDLQSKLFDVVEPNVNSPELFNSNIKKPLLIIEYFQLHNTFILFQTKKGLFIVDQHVAHERIFYEETIQSLSSGKSDVTQQLLFPVNVELSVDQIIFFEKYYSEFEKTGFSIKRFSGNTIIIDGIPSRLKNRAIEPVIEEMFEVLISGTGENFNSDEKFAASYACGAAIKAGQKLSNEEMNTLMDNLFQCNNPYKCPHGRPIMVEMSIKEIASKFDRNIE